MLHYNLQGPESWYVHFSDWIEIEAEMAKFSSIRIIAGSCLAALALGQAIPVNAQPSSGYGVGIRSGPNRNMTLAEYSTAITCTNAIRMRLEERANAGNSRARDLLRPIRESAEIMAAATSACLETNGISGITAVAQRFERSASRSRPNWLIPVPSTAAWVVSGLLIDRYSGFDQAGNIRSQAPLSREEIAVIARCAQASSSQPGPTGEIARVNACVARAGHPNLFAIARVRTLDPSLNRRR